MEWIKYDGQVLDVAKRYLVALSYRDQILYALAYYSISDKCFYEESKIVHQVVAYVELVEPKF